MTDVVVDPSVTTGPISGSRKYYRDLDGVAGARVPFRRVNLSNDAQIRGAAGTQDQPRPEHAVTDGQLGISHLAPP
jgi:hypothetical protein